LNGIGELIFQDFKLHEKLTRDLHRELTHQRIMFRRSGSGQGMCYIMAPIVAESFQPGARVCVVSAKYGLIASHLSGWRRQALKGEQVMPIVAAPAFVPLVIKPSISDIAAAAVGGTGEIRVEICCAVLHVAPDCSPERVYLCSTPHPMLQPIRHDHRFQLRG